MFIMECVFCNAKVECLWAQDAVLRRDYSVESLTAQTGARRGQLIIATRHCLRVAVGQIGDLCHISTLCGLFLVLTL